MVLLQDYDGTIRDNLHNLNYQLNINVQYVVLSLLHHLIYFSIYCYENHGIS